jgi:hypothetical protein
MSKRIVKLAVIRDNSDRKCPFGLSVPTACKTAGELINKMAPIAILGPDASEDEIEDLVDANNTLLQIEMPGERCFYAGKIFQDKEAVECNWTSNAPGVSQESALQASPFYSKVYNNVAYDGLYSYPLGWYADNNISRNLFYGIYSIHGSEDLEFIDKTGEEENSE